MIEQFELGGSAGVTASTVAACLIFVFFNE